MLLFKPLPGHKIYRYITEGQLTTISVELSRRPTRPSSSSTEIARELAGYASVCVRLLSLVLGTELAFCTYKFCAISKECEIMQ